MNPKKTRREPNGCLVWTGHLDKCGYSRANGRIGHRLAYEEAYGPIPAGMEIDHLCRTRACVEPTHLEAVSRRENIMRSKNFAAINARKTHCVNGHEFTPENTYMYLGWRNCKACISATGKRRWVRVRQAREMAASDV